MAGSVVGIIQIQSGALIDSASHLREGVGRDVAQAANFVERLHCSLLRLETCPTLFYLRCISTGKSEQLYERTESEALDQ